MVYVGCRGIDTHDRRNREKRGWQKFPVRRLRFLADCLKLGVEEACDQRGRGGFDRIVSQGSESSIGFFVCYREEPGARLITYVLFIDKDFSGRPYVFSEHLLQQRGWQSDKSHSYFLILSNGEGVAWKGEAQGQGIDEDSDEGFDVNKLIGRPVEEALASKENDEMESVQLQDNRRLGIATLGALKQHPRISAFREFVEGWYLSYFTPDAARSLPLAGPQRRLNSHGDNLGNVVQYMQREHPDRFKNILTKIADRIPGIDRMIPSRVPMAGCCCGSMTVAFKIHFTPSKCPTAR